MPAPRGGSRMVKSWDGPNLTATVEFTGSATGLPGARLEFTRARTLLRLIGQFSAYMDPSGAAAEDSAAITFALGVISTDAIQLGATAVPDPMAESDYPWLYWQTGTVYAIAGISGVQFPGNI